MSRYDYEAVAPKRAGEEVASWFAHERAETAGEELPTTADDFELSLAKWLRYVPSPFWPFIAAWVAEIARQSRVPVSAATLKALRGMMRRDVDDTVAELRGASPAVIQAWARWYPTWVAGQVKERADKDPWFLMQAEDYRRQKLSLASAVDGEKKAQQRDRKLGADLHTHLDRHGGIVRWRPGLIAKKLRHGRGRRPDARRVAEMAAALVRSDVAAWKLRPGNGKPWALVLTGTR